MKDQMLVEICVDTVESAIAAQEGGANRVELCDNLMEGGTTPGPGAILSARGRLSIGLHVMVRPRGGDFVYNEIELESMRTDVGFCRDNGVDGVVFGFLKSYGDIDVELVKEFVALARPMSVTFHRAFDVCRDPYLGLRQLMDAGVQRILTSGQEATGFEGAENIAKLRQISGGRIGIIGCGGLNARNVKRFVQMSGVNEVHMTAFTDVGSSMKYRNDRVFMGGTLRPPEFSRSVASVDMVREICRSAK